MKEHQVLKPVIGLFAGRGTLNSIASASSGVAILLLLCVGLPPTIASDKPESKTFQGSVETEIVLGPDGRLVIEIGGERNEYGPGDRVRLYWKDGVLYVNGQQVRPVPEREDPVLPVAEVKRICGDAPIVLRYVEEHRGEASDAEIWTRGARLWGERVEEVITEAMNQYATLVDGDEEEGRLPMGPDAAAQVAAQTLKAHTDLVASVTIKPTRYPELRPRFLSVFWKGKEDGAGAHVDLGSHVRPREASPQLVSRSKYDEFYSIFDWLSQEGKRTTVEIIDSAITIKRGAQPVEKEIR